MPALSGRAGEEEQDMKAGRVEGSPGSPEVALYQALGNRIRTARTQRGLSQLQLAEAVNLTRSSLSNVEHGKQRVLAHVLVAIGQALDVDPVVFLSDEELPRFTEALPYPVDRLKFSVELAKEHLEGLLTMLDGDVSGNDPIAEGNEQGEDAHG
jgi:transcriptional regulator with XRE-family HTH domain